MANRADVEMLNNAISGLGNSFAQRRQQQFEREQAMQRLALESQLRDIQEARYNAQGEHFNKMESAQQDYYNKVLTNQQTRDKVSDERNAALDKAAGLKQAVEDFKEAQQAMASSVQRIGQQVKAGKISNDDANQYFLGTMDSMPDAIKQKMQQTPEFQMVHAGKFDWATAASPPQPNITTTPGGAEIAIDPKTGAVKNLTHGKDPNALPPTKVTEIQRNAAGQATNQVTRFSPSAGYPPPPKPASVQPIPGGGGKPVATPPPGHISYLQNNPTPQVIQDFESKYGPGSAQQYLSTTQ